MPTGSILQPMSHAFTSPPLDEAKVHDAMRMGVFSCPSATPLPAVARIMATNRIHCIVVSDLEGKPPLGIVSDLDLASAAGPNVTRRTAGEVARTEMVTVGADESLAWAAQLMVKHGVAHLVVVQPQTGHPVGILSTLDLAEVIAWGGD